MSNQYLTFYTSETLKGSPALERSTEVIPPDVYTKAEQIVSEVRDGGLASLRKYAQRFGDIQSQDEQIIFDADDLEAAYQKLDQEVQGVLKRAAQQIEQFAVAQLSSLQAIDVPIPGGRAGHTMSPVTAAGCYAPGGRFPLPSSVLMTGMTAKVAGVKQIIVASPKPTTVTLAAAYLAGAQSLLAVGGAQAIAAMAYGVSVPVVDVIVGPGNMYVTAAKQAVSGRVRIDMLAGPSELVVLADQSADPETIAADLIGQAEHDVEARHSRDHKHHAC